MRFVVLITAILALAAFAVYHGDSATANQGNDCPIIEHVHQHPDSGPPDGLHSHQTIYRALPNGYECNVPIHGYHGSSSGGGSSSSPPPPTPDECTAIVARYGTDIQGAVDAVSDYAAGLIDLEQASCVIDAYFGVDD